MTAFLYENKAFKIHVVESVDAQDALCMHTHALCMHTHTSVYVLIKSTLRKHALVIIQIFLKLSKLKIFSRKLLIFFLFLLKTYIVGTC